MECQKAFKAIGSEVKGQGKRKPYESLLAREESSLGVRTESASSALEVAILNEWQLSPEKRACVSNRGWSKIAGTSVRTEMEGASCGHVDQSDHVLSEIIHLQQTKRRHGPGKVRFTAATRNAPDFILRRIGLRLATLLDEGAIGEPVYKLLEERLVAFQGIQVACERIRSTPTPFTYTLLIYRTAYAYCFLLPLGLAGTMGWATPLFGGLVAYAFFGLDALGDELEAPFDEHVNALPLLSLARTIEISLLEALGEVEIPEPLQPVHSVLT